MLYRHMNISADVFEVLFVASLGNRVPIHSIPSLLRHLVTRLPQNLFSTELLGTNKGSFGMVYSAELHQRMSTEIHHHM